MKMKKSKIIVPSLGLLLLSTAASVSGTVAWFTANRRYKMTAGDFAVVNTKDNLIAELGSGLGTTADNALNKVTISNAAYTLTDASFDHTSTTSNIIVPDDQGVAINKSIPLTSATFDNNASTGLLRETNIYSAFTWTITFKVSFSQSAAKDIGLYLAFDAGNTWAHEKVVYAEDHTILDTEVGTYYTNPECTENGVAKSAGQTLNAGTYYKVTPDDTGKGLRIAIVPTDIPANSYGMTKVWAPNQAAATHFIDESNTPAAWEAEHAYSVNDLVTYSTKYYKCKTANSDDSWTAANWVEVGGLEVLDTAIGTATTSKTGTAALAADTGAVLMDNTEVAGTADTSTEKADAKDIANYLGYFHRDPGNTVSMTYTCVVWYEGTDENITNDINTIYETMSVGMEFAVANLAD